MIRFNKIKMDEKYKMVMEFIQSVEESQDKLKDGKSQKDTKTS